MKFCYNTNFTLPKQSQRSRSILQDGSKYLGLFWKENTLSEEIRLLFNYQKADDKIFVCTFSKNVKAKLYHIENSKTRGQTV